MSEFQPPDEPTPMWSCDSIEVIAEIRDNATGVVREYETKTFLDDDDGQPHAFIWSDGNYACDCNRGLFFGLADLDVKCSDGAFSVRVRNKETGVVFYRDYAFANPSTPTAPPAAPAAS